MNFLKFIPVLTIACFGLDVKNTGCRIVPKESDSATTLQSIKSFRVILHNTTEKVIYVLKGAEATPRQGANPYAWRVRIIAKEDEKPYYLDPLLIHYVSPTRKDYRKLKIGDSVSLEFEIDFENLVSEKALPSRSGEYRVSVACGYRTSLFSLHESMDPLLPPSWRTSEKSSHRRVRSKEVVVKFRK